jgi:phage shock protein C
VLPELRRLHFRIIKARARIHMYCTRCGVQTQESANFCSACGNPTARNAYSAPTAYPKLSRPREDRKIAGVCAGFARYLGVDVALVRIIAIVLVLWPPGVGLIGYLIACIVMPNDPLRLPEATSPPHPSTPSGGAETATGRA